MELRPYQQHAMEAAWTYLRNRPGNPALVLPTGAGKSPLMAALAREAHENWQGRVGILAHTVELVEQNHAKLMALWPDAPAGMYAASRNARDRFAPILVAQIQSVAKRAHELGRFDLLLIDEAHRIPLAGEGLFLKFIADARRWNPSLRVVGLTATPFRLQGRAVPVCGPEHVLQDIAYEARIGDLIAQGFLSPLISRAGERPDLSGVHTRGGEYVEAELAAAVDRADLVERTADDLCLRAYERRAWIVFCVNVAHAEHVRDALVARGVATGIVHSGTPKAERASQLAAFQSGDLQAMVNVNVLSEGFDAPHIDCVAMLRPTKSPGLYYQQCGRGFRLSPGKADCLVLDYAGNVLEHGPVDAIRVEASRRGPVEVRTAAAKECPACSALLPIGARVCECGHVFSAAGPQHADQPIDAPVLSTQRERITTRHYVDSVRYATHAKANKTPSMVVTYQCGLRRFREWVCVEHAGTARLKAHAWWMQREPGCALVPRTADAAVAKAYGLPRPAWIVVDETNKFPEIVSYEWAERPVDASDARPGDRSVAPGAGADAVPAVRGAPRWLLPALESARTG